MRKRAEVKAVWESELEPLLRSLSIWEPLLLGELTCAWCGRTVDLENLGAIIPQQDKVKVVCDHAPCISSLTWSEVVSPHD